MTETYLDFIVERDTAASESTSLDLFSTSPTDAFSGGLSAVRCENGAPFFAYQRAGKTYGVVQGSCNSWTCKRCGQLVARQHYGRIVEGCRTLAKDNDLFFITLTCRGREITEAEAKKNYLKWTSKFFDACYTKQKRAKKTWAYVQVTELQKRGHPHSHVITTFCPDDIREGTVEKWSRDNTGRLVCEELQALRSMWIENQLLKSGLGTQYDITSVRSTEACSRYVAKYMFKDAQFKTHFPKHWKRVRYSQTFPQLPEKETNAFVLLSREDWSKLAGLAAVVIVNEKSAEMEAQYFMQGHDIVISLREKDASRAR